MTTTNNTNKKESINETIAELKEYMALEAELKAQIEELKKECIDYLIENGIEEETTEDGKIIYREVISRRFASTEFKKVHADLYEAFSRRTSNMRFNIS